MKSATAPDWLRRAGILLWILVGIFAVWTVTVRFLWPPLLEGLAEGTRATNLALQDFVNAWNMTANGFGLVAARIATYPVLDEVSFALWAGGLSLGTIVAVAVLAGSQPGRRRDKHIRGARLKAPPSLIGRWVGRKAKPGYLTIGGIAIDRATEVEHMLISGATGTGKSTIMDGWLIKIRERGDRCIVFDKDARFYSRHGRDSDIILNPYDRRSREWSPFAELRRDEDYMRVAVSMVPNVSNSGNGEWLLYAQRMVADIMRALVANGTPSPKLLYQYATAASPEGLRHILQGTPSATFSEPDNERFLGSVRSVMTPFQGYWPLLPEGGDLFSVRDWIRDESRRESLFVTYFDNQKDNLAPYLGAIASVAMVEALSLTESRDRRLFFILDELAAMGPVAKLPDLMAQVRKFGGSMVLAVQVLAQLQELYGEKMATAIIANAATKVVLRQGDAGTAILWEAELGEREVMRRSENRSENSSRGNGGGSRWSRSFSDGVHSERVMLASELMALPKFHGVLMQAAKPHQRFDRLEAIGMRQTRETFVPKDAVSVPGAGARKE